MCVSTSVFRGLHNLYFLLYKEIIGLYFQRSDIISLYLNTFLHKKIGIWSKTGAGQKGLDRLRGASSVHFFGSLTSASVNMLIQQSLQGSALKQLDEIL